MQIRSKEREEHFNGLLRCVESYLSCTKTQQVAVSKCMVAICNLKPYQ